MSVPESAQQAIEEFVDAIVEQYVTVKRRSSDDKPISDAGEFVSAIEQDLRSTLRDRLSKLETVKKAANVSTADSAATLLGEQIEPAGAGESNAQPPLSEFVPSVTVDTPMEIELDATTELEVQVQDDAARGGSVPASSDVDAVTLDPDARSDSSKPSVRPGRSANASDLSYDHPTMDSDQRTSAVVVRGVERKTERKSPDVPTGYEILGTLGKGGMGVVYKARHVPLNRLVAVKMIIGGVYASPEQLMRFQREAEASAHLTHPNIVSVYEVGRHKGMPYLSLEFVEGQSLSDMMKQQTLSAKHAAELLIPVARAVHYSHQMGVLHRDLKPQNILLTDDGTPKVADFGLAKRLGDDDNDEMTKEGVVVGTPGYMAPEQAKGDAVDPRTDVYALGSILYYMMTGRPPFAAPTPMETVRQLLVEEPVWPSKLQSSLDKDLETICLKSLEKETSRRYQSAEEMADELQRYLDGKPIVARPITRQQRLWKWCKRNPYVATLSGLAASLLLCLLFGGIISAVVINEQKKKEQIARQDAEDTADALSEIARLVIYDIKAFFKSKPELEPLRPTLMTAVVDRIEKHYENRRQKNKSAVFAASADRHLGEIYLDTGDYELAVEKLSSAERQLSRFAAEGRVARAEASQMLITLALGDAYFGLGELDRAQEQFVRLENQRSEYVSKDGDVDIIELGALYGKLVKIYQRLGRPDKYRDYLAKAIELRRTDYEVNPSDRHAAAEYSGALLTLSEAYEWAGETDKMLKPAREALAVKLRLLEEEPSTTMRCNIARDQFTIGRQCLILGADQDAREILDEATSTLKQVVPKTENASIKGFAITASYWQGVALKRLGQDASSSFDYAEKIQRAMLETSNTVDNRGSLLKILSRAGRTEEAMKIADQMAALPDDLNHCAYAAIGYALLSEQTAPDDAEKSELIEKAIDYSKRLVGHGFHEFNWLRKTNLDFQPLQRNRAYLKMLDEQEERVEAEKSRNAPAKTRSS